MPKQVPPEVVAERYHKLMSLQQRIALSRNQRWVGRQVEVLIESPREHPGEWVGRAFRDAPEVDGAVYLSVGRGLRAAPHTSTPLQSASPRPPLRPGAFVQATVTAAGPYDLRADLLSHRPRSTP
jgi:ribosomal protein S12 methylthiotransferase